VTWPGGRFGTFTLITVAGGAASSHPIAMSANSVAVPQCHNSSLLRPSSDTAADGNPNVEAVSAAPTVPEWRIAWPVFGPLLIPASTTSGGGPKAPDAPTRTM
jgi:hypothetical protein